MQQLRDEIEMEAGPLQPEFGAGRQLGTSYVRWVMLRSDCVAFTGS